MDAPAAPPFDWLNPDYHPIWQERVRRLARLRAEPALLLATKRYYKEADDGCVRFIEDWGVTVDPRNQPPRPIIMPFVLFPLQRDFLLWLRDRHNKQEDGILVKSRDCGASWLAMAFSVWMGLFNEDVTIGFGSALKDKVDNSGDPDSLFYKGRKFLEYLPPEFKGAWSVTNKYHSADMRLYFPSTGSTITGDCGDRIGRGGRKRMFFVDEFATVERPKLVDANLIANTDCRIEMSSVMGLANVFAERALGGKINRFDFHYRHDPRKVFYDENGVMHLYGWFAEKKANADPVTWKQEYECDFRASSEGMIIPPEWVEACVGAAQRLGITVDGDERIAFDVADLGKDKCCIGYAKGIELRWIHSFPGGPGRIYASCEEVVRECDARKITRFKYDADGMGAAVPGDMIKINSEREDKKLKPVHDDIFRGSGEVHDKESKCEGTDRLNQDFFENYKAQSWWALRRRAWLTYNWVVNGVAADPAAILSISPQLPELDKTKNELSQPVWKWSKTGKMMIDKTPDDVASPNNGDTVMMLFSYGRPPMRFSAELFEIL